MVENIRNVYLKISEWIWGNFHAFLMCGTSIDKTVFKEAMIKVEVE